jgi:hypothetical protein
MGDLEDVDVREVGDGSEEAPLGGGLQVAEEQHGEPLGADQQGDAGVVGAVVRECRADGGWPEDLPVERAEPAPLPHCGADHRDVGGGCLAADVDGLFRWLVEGGGLDGAHCPAAQHAGKAVDVVGVEVGEYQKGDGGDAEPAEAAVGEVGLGSGVDHHGGAGTCGQHEGVSLSHIAGDHAPVLRRPAGDGPGKRVGTEHRQKEQEGEGSAQPRVACRAPAEEQGGCRERREE